MYAGVVHRFCLPVGDAAELLRFGVRLRLWRDLQGSEHAGLEVLGLCLGRRVRRQQRLHHRLVRPERRQGRLQAHQAGSGVLRRRRQGVRRRQGLHRRQLRRRQGQVHARAAGRHLLLGLGVHHRGRLLGRFLRELRVPLRQGHLQAGLLLDDHQPELQRRLLLHQGRVQRPADRRLDQVQPRDRRDQAELLRPEFEHQRVSRRQQLHLRRLRRVPMPQHPDRGLLRRRSGLRRQPPLHRRQMRQSHARRRRRQVQARLDARVLHLAARVRRQQVLHQGHLPRSGQPRRRYLQLRQDRGLLRHRRGLQRRQGLHRQGLRELRLRLRQGQLQGELLRHQRGLQRRRRLHARLVRSRHQHLQVRRQR